MSNYQLSSKEIQTVFDFVESKHVPYKDVRFEIVDHLASGIEEMKTENPNLSIGHCLQKMFEQFPKRGFEKLQEEKEKAMSQMWIQKIVPIILSYFKLPRIILTLGSFYILHELCLFVESVPRITYFIFLISLCIIVSLSTFIYKNEKEKLKKKQEEEYLFLKSFYKATGKIASFLITVPFFFAFLTNSHDGSMIFTGIYSYLIPFFFVNLGIFSHLYFVIYPKMLEEEVDKKYQHLNLTLVH